jgi:zinc protease
MMRSIFLAAGCFAASLAFAQQREAPPQGSEPKPFHAPKRDSFTLPNGLHVAFAPYGMIPKVDAELVVQAGDVTEANDKQGSGNLLAELMKQGTESLSASQLADAFAAIGGDLTISVSEDQVSVRGTSLEDGADKLISLLADVALHPKLPESELPRLKQDLLRSVAVAKARPGTMAAEEFLKVVYGNNGYGRAVFDSKVVESLNLADVKAYYAKYFVPANATLYVSGVMPKSLRKKVEGSFASWQKGEPPAPPSIKAEAKRTLGVVDRPGAPQSTIYMGLPVARPQDKDWVPLQVTNALLGGSFMSRITSNIREAKGYTYSPHSMLESNAENVIWAQHADVTTQFTGASLKEIYGEIDGLRKKAPPVEEVKAIENGMAGTFIYRNSSRRGIISQMKFVDLQKLPSDYLDNYISNVFAVKPQDVQAIMEKYIDPSKMTVVVVGDKSKIDSQVEQFKPSGQ